MTRYDVVTEARSWIDTRYQHQASLKGVGADCIGFVGGVAVALGLPEALAWARDPAVKGYGGTPDGRMLLEACRKYLDPVSTALAGIGDVLVFRWATDPAHFAIISSLEPMRIIHAFSSARKVAENQIDGEWRKGTTWRSLIVGAWRFRGVD